MYHIAAVSFAAPALCVLAKVVRTRAQTQPKKAKAFMGVGKHEVPADGVQRGFLGSLALFAIYR